MYWRISYSRRFLDGRYRVGRRFRGLIVVVIGGSAHQNGGQELYVLVWNLAHRIIKLLVVCA
jgi:hypothetical protein